MHVNFNKTRKMRIQEEMNWNRKVTRSSCHVNLYDLSTEMRMKKKEKCIEVFKSHESDLSSRILAHAMQFIFQHPLKFIPFVCILLHRSLPRDPWGEVNDRREKFIRQTTIKTVFSFFVSSLFLSFFYPSFARDNVPVSKRDRSQLKDFHERIEWNLSRGIYES